MCTNYGTITVIIYSCKEEAKGEIRYNIFAEREVIMKRVRIGNLWFVVFTMCLVFVSAFCITKTVQSQTNEEQIEAEQYYRAQEEQLVDEVRVYLNEAGYKNSGVMLTRVVAADGWREYTVSVHHDKINKMDVEKKEELRKQLSGFRFSADNCIFYHEFLEAD